MVWYILVYVVLAGVATVAFCCWHEGFDDEEMISIAPYMLMFGCVVIPVWLVFFAPNYAIRAAVNYLKRKD